MTDLPVPSLPPCRVDPKVLGLDVLIDRSEPGGSWTSNGSPPVRWQTQCGGDDTVMIFLLGWLSQMPEEQSYLNLYDILLRQRVRYDQTFFRKTSFKKFSLQLKILKNVLGMSHVRLLGHTWWHFIYNFVVIFHIRLTSMSTSHRTVTREKGVTPLTTFIRGNSMTTVSKAKRW